MGDTKSNNRGAKFARSSKRGMVRAGIGGWTFAPWRGTFYPAGLVQRRELEYAASQLSSIEINGTYYSSFKPDSWCKWRDETPDDFVFAVKASRYTTNRKILAEAGPSIERFLEQGISELGAKLGPINWQFMATKKFDADDFGAFLDLLPKDIDGLTLRHALEVRHDSFMCDEFYELARAHNAAIIYAEDEKFPAIDIATADFSYCRLMSTRADETEGLTAKEIAALAKKTDNWAKRGDTFVYFISGAKEKNPAAALALIDRLS